MKVIKTMTFGLYLLIAVQAKSQEIKTLELVNSSEKFIHRSEYSNQMTRVARPNQIHTKLMLEFDTLKSGGIYEFKVLLKNVSNTSVTILKAYKTSYTSRFPINLTDDIAGSIEPNASREFVIKVSTKGNIGKTISSFDLQTIGIDADKVIIYKISILGYLER